MVTTAKKNKNADAEPEQQAGRKRKIMYNDSSDENENEKVPPPAMATTDTTKASKDAEMEQQPGSSRKRKAENDPEAPKAKKIVHTKASSSSSSREGQADDEDDDGDDGIPTQFTLRYAARVLQMNPEFVDEWDMKPKKPSKECRICGEKFGDYMLLEGHFLSHHTRNNPKVLCFLCPICRNKKGYRHMKSYMKHLTVHVKAAKAEAKKVA
jgi:hypothetical protein